MASASATPQYPELVPHDNANDHGASITIAAAFLMTLTLLFLCARIIIRWPVRVLWKYDDSIALAASAVATIQAALILASVNDGLGAKATARPNVHKVVVLKQIYAGSILFVIAYMLGKLAVALLCYRLSASEQHRRVCKILSMSIIVWGLASVVLVTLRQDVQRPWSLDSMFAQSTLIRWIAIEALGAIFEFSFVGFMTWLLADTQMDLGKKLTVLFGLIAIAIVRLYVISRAANRPVYPTFASTNPEILTQLEMHLNIITATVPSMHVFLKTLESGNFGSVNTTMAYYARNAYDSDGKGSRIPGDQDGSLRINVNQTFELTTMERDEMKPSRGAKSRVDDAASDDSFNALYGYRDRAMRAGGS